MTLDTNRAARIKHITSIATEKFDADDWKILQSELPYGYVIGQHNRLYRSLAFGDDDYCFNVADVITSLIDLEESDLEALEEYIAHAYGDAGNVSIQETDEKNRACLIFISHKAEEKFLASSLKNAFSTYGIDAFVAHDDIHVTAEWEHAIEEALWRCDAFVYLASQKSNTSEWCQQEIGWAFGRNIPMVSVALDENPTGFLGARQALRCGRSFQADQVAKEVFEIIVGDDRVTDIVVDGLIRKLEGSTCFDESNRITGLLRQVPHFTSQQAARIEEAILANNQISGASHGNLPNMLRQLIREKTFEDT